MLKPFEIRTLMRAYAKDLPAAASDSKTSGATKVLVDAGLIDSLRQITPRGEAFITMLCATPLPTQTWTDPRTGSSVAGDCPGCVTCGLVAHAPGCPKISRRPAYEEPAGCPGCGADASEVHAPDCPRATPSLPPLPPPTVEWRCSSCGVEAGGKHLSYCVRFQGGTTVSPIGAERVR